ncbi:MAG: hypothetical protein JWM59_3465 [Verrucomicrobiales bacterium]|nr:hypothetical protein [Verrucomicrobiales bacterium]
MGGHQRRSGRSLVRPPAAEPVRAFDPSLVQQALQRLTANADDYGSQLELRCLMF